MIEDAYKKVRDLDIKLDEIEAKIKQFRIKDCEQAIKISFVNLDKIRKLIEKYNT